ncbi:type VI secretion system-associated protein TagF [Variovorax sp. J22R24]|uniref:type VI secretion system-associated protein TagF n=1 Tax=Variovorax gracilis TaxID=3053502 RepID=UPI0025777E20|nr:type VI secretion system-associated protein TagF [Variovorax sp. J22R24]MDM0109038.1 type VI secretion system-associated protein TagF [Variovorax sp. J22R24]
MSAESSPVVSDAAPGWFGKLPGMADFAHRRLPDDFRDAWERWLRHGLARLRVTHQDWTERYLEAPIWCFVLGNGVIGGPSWVGVMMPSVDGEGRCFPFTLTQELVAPRSELKGEALADVRQWWGVAIQAAREGLDRNLDAIAFEVLLHQLFANQAVRVADQDSGAALALPVVGQSLWFTDPRAEGGLGMASQALPQDDQFEALFGYPPGASAQGLEPS